MLGMTPLEIQKQTFSKSLKGYSVDEVRAYLHLVAEELERVLREADRLTRENGRILEDIAENSERERILKDTLLSAQKVSEEVKANARKEAELVVKDAELISERIIAYAMTRVANIEKAIQDLKIERKSMRNKLQATLETFQQMVLLDGEEEANELPITQIYRKNSESA